MTAIRCSHPTGCLVPTLANESEREQENDRNYFRSYRQAGWVALFFGTPPSRSKLIAKAFTWSAFSTGLKRTYATQLLGSLSASTSSQIRVSRRQSVRTDWRLPCHVRFQRWDMHTFPVSHFTTPFIENSFVVFQPHFPRRLCVERIPQRLVLIEDRQVFGLIGRCDCVSPKQKTVRVAPHKSSDSCC